MHVADHAFEKAAFAVAKVKFPHADKGFGVAEAAHLSDIGKEAFAPQAEGGGVMRGDVFQMKEPHVGGAGDGLRDGAYRGDAASRKNIALDKIHVALGVFIILVGNHNGLKQHGAFGF